MGKSSLVLSWLTDRQTGRSRNSPVVCHFVKTLVRIRKIKLVNMADTEKVYGSDPKNVQDLTAFVQTLLTQMQDKFQNMSDQIINRIDDMGTRIDDLEKNIADLMTQAGVNDGSL